MDEPAVTTPPTDRTVRHFAPTAPLDEIVATLRTDGAVIIDQLVDGALIDQTMAELGPSIEATPYSADDFGGRLTKRTGSLIARSPTSRMLVQHPMVRSVVADILGHATNHQLHLTWVRWSWWFVAMPRTTSST